MTARIPLKGLRCGSASAKFLEDFLPFLREWEEHAAKHEPSDVPEQKGARVTALVDSLLDEGNLPHAEEVLERHASLLDHDGMVEEKSDSRLIFYIAGYVVRKSLKKFPCPDCAYCLCIMPLQAESNCNATLTNQFNHRGLLYPSDALEKLITKLENAFIVFFSRNKLHAESLFSTAPGSSSMVSSKEYRSLVLVQGKWHHCRKFSYATKEMAKMMAHFHTHTGEPFQCHLCPAVLAQKDGLKQHLRTHTGERSFSCAHCSASFLQRNALKEHLYVHTGERPFSCVHCDAAFLRKGNLNRHIIYYHKNKA
nr:zinc finger protein 271-like [Rhipicephalus microplus]